MRYAQLEIDFNIPLILKKKKGKRKKKLLQVDFGQTISECFSRLYSFLLFGHAERHVGS